MEAALSLCLSIPIMGRTAIQRRAGNRFLDLYKPAADASPGARVALALCNSGKDCQDQDEYHVSGKPAEREGYETGGDHHE